MVSFSLKILSMPGVVVHTWKHSRRTAIYRPPWNANRDCLKEEGGKNEGRAAGSMAQVIELPAYQA
jgi:hypothetical protein